MEPELQQAPPRPVRLTPAGRRELLYPILAVLAVLAVCGAAYAGRPAPGAMMPLFVGFLGLGVYLTVRLLEVWHKRTLLVREGRAMTAVVVEISEPRDGKCRFLGWYEAGDRQWSLEWSGREGSAEIGDAVTALYLPAEPGCAIHYATSGCEAILLGAAEALGVDQSPLTPRI